MTFHVPSADAVHAVISRRRDTSWWVCHPFVAVVAQPLAAVQVAEDAREAHHRENAVGQKMAQQGNCPKRCCVVALLLEASGTHAAVSGCDCAVISVHDRVKGSIKPYLPYHSKR